jgi:hypothetical protein
MNRLIWYMGEGDHAGTFISSMSSSVVSNIGLRGRKKRCAINQVTEIPSLIETMLANNASDIHTAAISQTFESTANLLDEKKKNSHPNPDWEG